MFEILVVALAATPKLHKGGFSTEQEAKAEAARLNDTYYTLGYFYVVESNN